MDLINAIYKAFKKNISHNDLKPENIFSKINDKNKLHFLIGDWGGSC